MVEDDDAYCSNCNRPYPQFHIDWHERQCSGRVNLSASSGTLKVVARQRWHVVASYSSGFRNV